MSTDIVDVQYCRFLHAIGEANFGALALHRPQETKGWLCQPIGMCIPLVLRLYGWLPISFRNISSYRHPPRARWSLEARTIS
jgi:hypothetical protein